MTVSNATPATQVASLWLLIVSPLMALRQVTGVSVRPWTVEGSSGLQSVLTRRGLDRQCHGFVEADRR